MWVYGAGRRAFLGKRYVQLACWGKHRPTGAQAGCEPGLENPPRQNPRGGLVFEGGVVLQNHPVTWVPVQVGQLVLATASALGAV